MAKAPLGGGAARPAGGVDIVVGGVHLGWQLPDGRIALSSGKILPKGTALDWHNGRLIGWEIQTGKRENNQYADLQGNIYAHSLHDRVHSKNLPHGIDVGTHEPLGHGPNILGGLKSLAHSLSPGPLQKSVNTLHDQIAAQINSVGDALTQGPGGHAVGHVASAVTNTIEGAVGGYVDHALHNPPLGGHAPAPAHPAPHGAAPIEGTPTSHQTPTHSASTPPASTTGSSHGGSAGSGSGTASAAHKVPSDVYQAIARAAKELGVPLNLALAIAQQESGFNPHAIGDHGTSFGLYQLHRGGELGNMTPEQAYDPYTNAKTALSVVAQVYHQHPNWSPGQIAAAAQRPADPVGYAHSIDGILNGGRTTYADSGVHSTGSSGGSSSGSGGSGSGGSGGGGSTSGGGAAGGSSGGSGLDWNDPKAVAAAFQNAGYAAALINSDAGLREVFRWAITNHVDATSPEFANKIQETNWWKSRNAYQRDYDMRNLTPSMHKGLSDQVAQVANLLTQQAVQFGATLTPLRAHDLAVTLLRNFGNSYQQSDINAMLGSEVHYNPKVSYGGALGKAVTDIKAEAAKQGVTLPDDMIGQWATKVASGKATTDQYVNFIKDQAAAKYPWLKPQLDAGFTVSDLAQGYRNEIANTLEIDPNSIKLDDPLIQKGLQWQDPSNTKGGYTTMPYYQYQQMLRNDPRYEKTDQFRNQSMDIATGVLKDMGLAS